MAIEPYRAQVRNTVVLRMPPRGAGAQGEAVGQGIARIGAALGQAGAVLDDAEENRLASEHRLAMAEQAREREQQLADWNRQFVLHRTNMADIVRVKRGSAPAGAVGHTSETMAAYNAPRDTLLARYTDPEVQRLAAGQWDEFAARLHGSEADFEDGKRVEKQLTDTKDAVGLSANLIRVQPSIDPTTYDEEMKRNFDVIGMMSVDEATRVKLRTAVHSTLAEAYITRVTELDPVQGRQLLDSGHFARLDPQTAEQLRNRADVGIRSQEVEARSAAAMLQRDLTGQIGNAKQIAVSGAPQSDEMLLALQSNVEQLPPGPSRDGLLLDIKDARARNDVVVSYAKATPAVIAGDIAQLDAQIAKAGTAADPSLTFRRNALQAVLSERRQEVAENPGQLAARLGSPLVVIDWSAPTRAEVDRRASTIDAVADETGRPANYFLADELAQLRADPSARGQRGALRAARQFRGARAVQAARQLFPGDEFMAYLVTLPDATVGKALDGKELLAQPGEKPKFSPVQTRTRAGWDVSLRQALRTLGAAQQGAVLKAVDALEAGFVSQGDPPMPARQAAIHMALGGVMRGGVWYGGMGNWNDHPLLLPHGVSGSMFGEQTGREVQRNGPVNESDGSPANIHRAVPVPIGRGRYHWLANGQPLLRKDGTVFTVEIKP